MRYYHLRLSQEKKIDESIIRQRLESGFIGLELKDEDTIHQPLNTRLVNDEKLQEIINDFLTVKTGDLVIIYNNEMFFAITRVIGNYVFKRENETWCQHCYPVEILTYYSDKLSVFYNKYFSLCPFIDIFERLRDESFVHHWYQFDFFTKPSLKSIKIKGFKNFSNLEISNFKQINLITGKNNIGKTNLLEACYLYLKYQGRIHTKKQFDPLIEMMEMRNSSNQKLHNINNLDVLSAMAYPTEDEYDLSMQLSSFIGKEIQLRYDLAEDEAKLSFSGLENKNMEKMSYRILFIPATTISSELLSKFFTKIRFLRKRNFLNQAIQNNFNKNIKEFDIFNKKPKLYIDNDSRNWISINEFGDGIKRFVTILCAIWVCKNGVCFIDEIENGLHYTLHDNLWKLIFTTSKEANCQLFISTHSLEIIQSLNKVAKQQKEIDINLIRLLKSKHKDRMNEIVQISYDAELLDYTMQQEHEVRGW